MHTLQLYHHSSYAKRQRQCQKCYKYVRVTVVSLLPTVNPAVSVLRTSHNSQSASFSVNLNFQNGPCLDQPLHVKIIGALRLLISRIGLRNSIVLCILAGVHARNR